MENIKVIRKKGKLAGNKVVVLAGVHGNEVCGVQAFDKLLPTLEIEKGEAVFIYANLEAIKQNKTFIETNLNRCFYPAVADTTLEGRSAKQIKEYLDWADYLLDIHATQVKDSVAFAICDPHSFEFAKVMPFEIVSYNWDPYEPGATDYYMNLSKKVALCIECGYMNDPKSQGRAEVSLINFLKKTGLISGEAEKQKKQKFYKITGIYKNKESFKKTKFYPNFYKLKDKEIIGMDGTTPVYEEKNTVLLFVHSFENPGEECFLTAKED